jgi:hypothetical protein
MTRVVSDNAPPLSIENLRTALTRAVMLLRAASDATGHVAESRDEPAIKVALDNYLECHARVVALSHHVDRAVVSEVEYEKWCARFSEDSARAAEVEVKASRRHLVNTILRVQLMDVVTNAFEECRDAMKRHIDAMERAFARGSAQTPSTSRRALDS